MTSVTLIIPCYNEGARLPHFLTELCHLAKDDKELSIVVSDDGSRPEDVSRVVAAVSQLKLIKWDLRFDRQLVNKGKGAAIARVARHAQTDIIGFVDADGSVTASECLRLLREYRQARNHVGVLPAGFIGSRVKMLGTNIERHWHRHVIGRVFATILSNLFDIAAYDTQCGCKFFERQALMSVIDHAYDQRWIWDTQLLILLIKGSWSVIEKPISWHETPGSKVSLLRDPLKLLIGLFRFRRYLETQQVIQKLLAASKVQTTPARPPSEIPLVS